MSNSCGNKLALYLLIYFSIIVMQNTAGEVVLDRDILRNFTSNNHIKYWFSYIKKFLNKNLKITFIQYQLMQHSHVDFTEESLRRASTFQQKSKTPQLKIENPLSGIASSYKSVTIPCGKLIALRHSFKSNRGEYTHTWKFRLDEQLRLNLTFHFINIYILNIGSCHIGKLTILDLNSPLYRKTLEYCGIYAFIPNYPKRENVDISLSYVQHFTLYYIAVSFSVIDPGIVVSSNIKKFGSLRPQWILQFQLQEKKGSQVQKYYVKVSQLRHILVKFSTGKYSVKVFNGPGTLSKELKSISKTVAEEKYKTTSFQCVIYMYGFDLDSAKELKYYSRNLSVINTKYITLPNMTMFSYPSSEFHCFGDVCPVRIATEANFFINVTTIQIRNTYNYKSKYNHKNTNCMFGGWTVYELKNQSYEEISTTCSTQETVFSIYSTISSVLLVMYSYREYDLMNLTLALSVTTCKAYRFNACESPKYRIEESHCSIYQLFQSLSLTRVLYSVLRFHKTQCITQLSFPAVKEPKKNIVALVTGFLRGSYLPVSVLGAPSEVCYHPKSSTRRERNCGTNANSFIQDALPLLITRKTPTNNESLGLKIGFHNSERNLWLVIYVAVMNITETNKTMHFLDTKFTGETLTVSGKYSTIKGGDFKNIIAPDLLIYFYAQQASEIVNIRIHTCYSISSQYHYLWQESLWLSGYNPAYLVSLRSRIANLFIQGQGESTNGVLKAYWIERQNSPCGREFMDESPRDLFHDYFICGSYEYHSFARNPGLTWESTDEIKLFDTMNSSKKNRRSKRSFKQSRWSMPAFMQNGRSKLTWKNASDWCKSRDGHLPIINSRAEQDEIVNLWKDVDFDTFYTPQNILFIGLQLYYPRKPSNEFVWENGDPVSFQPWKENNHVSTQSLPLLEALFCYGNAKNHTFDSKVYSIHTGQICAAISFDNLAYPKWFTIRCDEPLTTSVLCSLKKDQNVKQTEPVTSGAEIFNSSCILMTNTCWIFEYGNFSEQSKITFTEDGIKKFYFLFDAVGINFPPLALNKTHEAVYNRYGQLSYFQIQETKQNVHHKFNIVTQSSWKFQFGGNLFVCENQMAISITSLCDDHNDCEDSSDEINCNCKENQIYSYKCKNVTTEENKTLCSVYYLRTIRESCFLYKTILDTGNIMRRSIFHLPSEQLCTFYKFYMADQIQATNTEYSCICKNGMTINISMVNDLVVDCKEDADDEYFLTQIGMGNFSTCLHNYQIPCRIGHPKCYNVSQICTYKLNKINHVIPCRTGSHLENCNEFECNMMFKCPQHYCIPWSYVCDGKWDCPGGHDENITNTSCMTSKDCQNMFKCKSANKCIHLNDVCDGTNDCPNRDDEEFCSLHEVICLSFCQCLTFAINCKDVTSVPKSGSELPYHILYIVYSLPRFAQHVLKLAKQVISLTLNRNQLSKVCDVRASYQNIQFIDLSFNLIKSLKNKCFPGGKSVKVLKLHDNIISSLQTGVFSDLKSLVLLDLSKNKLQKLESNIFHGISGDKLKILFIKHNILAYIDPKSLQEMKLLYLSTDDYRLCCIKHQTTKCSKTQNAWHISCRPLMTNSVLRVLVNIISAVLLFCNFLSLLTHVFSSTKNVFSGSFRVTVTSINAIDLLYGLYLIVLGTQDLYFKELFFLYEMEWRSSLLCLLCSSIALYFSFMSPLLLLFLTYQRYMILNNPLQAKLKESRYATRRVISLYIVFLIVVLTMVTVLTYLHGTLALGSCLPFVDPTHTMKVVNVITSSTVFCQIVSLLLIGFTSVKIIHILNKAAEQFEGRSLYRQPTTAMITQICIMIVSNTLSWVPSGIIYILLMFLLRYPIDLVFVTALVITPINSICIPLLFLITARKKLTSEYKSRQMSMSLSFP